MMTEATPFDMIRCAAPTLHDHGDDLRGCDSRRDVCGNERLDLPLRDDNAALAASIGFRSGSVVAVSLNLGRRGAPPA